MVGGVDFISRGNLALFVDFFGCHTGAVGVTDFCLHRWVLFVPELYINGVIQCVLLCLASFVQRFIWEIYSCCIGQKFVFFIVAVCIPQFSYPFYCWQLCVVSSLGLLWGKLLWISLHKSFGEHRQSFLLCIFLGMELLGLKTEFVWL